jgi:hypothetical protein
MRKTNSGLDPRRWQQLKAERDGLPWCRPEGLPLFEEHSAGAMNPADDDRALAPIGRVISPMSTDEQEGRGPGLA